MKLLLVIFIIFISSCAIVPENKNIYDVDSNKNPVFYCAKLESVTIKENEHSISEDQVNEESAKQKKWHEYNAKYFTEKDDRGNECKEIQKIKLEVNLHHSNNFMWAFIHGFTLGIIPFWQNITRDMTIDSTSPNCVDCMSKVSQVKYTIYSSIFLLPVIPFRDYSLVETSEKIHSFQIHELANSNDSNGIKP